MRHQLNRREYLELIVAGGAWLMLPHAAHAAAVDVGGAEAAGKRSRVISACRAHWPDNKGDCSAFVRAVSQKVGLALTGDANSIYEQINTAPWTRIGIGTSAATIAGVSAGEGKLVVAARKAQPHGHVAIVVDYRNAFDTYQAVDRQKAVAFWGNLGSVGAEHTRITMSWTAAQLGQVLYAYRPIP